TDQATGDRGVITEGHPRGIGSVGTVSGDPQPYPPRPGRALLRSKAASGQCCRPRSFQHDIGCSQQVLQGNLVTVEIYCIAELSTVHPVEEALIAGTGAVR